MTKLNIQTSDGRLITIEGGEEAVAHWARSGLVHSSVLATNDEEPLPLPALNFSKVEVKPQHAANEGEEVPLMPKLF